jgi:hypothetical protein
MQRKTLLGILISTAVLSVACLCCPLNLLQYVEFPTAVPATLPPVVTEAPVATVDPSLPEANYPACTSSLTDLLHASQEQYTPGQELSTDYTLVTYTVINDSITDPVYDSSIPNSLMSYQEDTANQEKVWTYVTDILPADQRTWITQFVVFTDGVNNSLGAVEQADNPHDWILELDIEDAASFPDLSTTLIHEFAHLLTLNDNQVTTDYKVFNNPDDQQIFDQEAAKCSSYFMYEGCSRPDSYINSFFNRFWLDIYDQWQTINAEPDPDVLDQELSSFYQEYADQFVSDYSATSPEEDIAESFMFFIFTSRPDGTSIADQKILFFYEYPELVSLREQLLANLCTHLETP